MSVGLRPLSLLPSGTALSRYIVAKAHGRGDAMRALVIAERWNDTPQVKACLEDELRGKAAIVPGTTSDATFAAPLAAHGIAAEALELVPGLSILGALENKFRRVPFRTNVPREVAPGTGGAWVGEALSIPAASTGYDTLSQSNYKAQVITVLTTELLQFSRSAERALRETVANGLAAYLDQQLLTNTVTLSANVDLIRADLDALDDRTVPLDAVAGAILSCASDIRRIDSAAHRALSVSCSLFTNVDDGRILSHRQFRSPTGAPEEAGEAARAGAECLTVHVDIAICV